MAIAVGTEIYRVDHLRVIARGRAAPLGSPKIPTKSGPSNNTAPVNKLPVKKAPKKKGGT